MDELRNSDKMRFSAKLRSKFGLMLVISLALFGNVHTVYADGSGNTDTITGAVCMQDVYDDFGQGGDLNCTANDVSLATATIITSDGCDFPGDTVTFTANFEIVVGAGTRSDVGIYFSTDGDTSGEKICTNPDGTLSGSLSSCTTDADCSGSKVCAFDGALTGACSVSTPAYDDDNNSGTTSAFWLDTDGTTNNTTPSNDFGYCSLDAGSTVASPTTPCDGGSPAAGDAQCVAELGAGATCEEFGDSITSPIQDTCGDISKLGSNPHPIYPIVTQTVACVDSDGNGQLDLPYCTSWRQDGANELCTTPLAAYPGSPSKCNCNSGFGVPIAVPGQIIVDKVTLPTTDSTNFDFSITGSDTDLPDNFSLNHAATPHASPGLDAGTYSVTETANSDYTTTVECLDDDGNSETPTAIDLQVGETVTCTFTNTHFTAVLLSRFNAISRGEGAIISWTTASEVDNAGFNVYSSNSANGPWVQVNDTLIPAKGSVLSTATYTFADDAGAAYYMLEDVDTKGKTTPHGPVSSGGNTNGLSSNTTIVFMPMFY